MYYDKRAKVLNFCPFYYIRKMTMVTYGKGKRLEGGGEERLYKILIVEDDETIAGGLKNHLGKWNYQAECMTDFKDVMGKFVDFEPQLVLLDIVLPFFNGFHWCQEIRKISKVPIIFLSSANDNMNIVMAMNMGGDEIHRETV